jgi:hypothetical protein
MEWVNKEDDRGFFLEGVFLTRWGVERELRRSDFVRSAGDIRGLNSYIRYWPEGIHAVARVHPRAGTSRVKVTISHYNNKGRKFRRLPAASG